MFGSTSRLPEARSGPAEIAPGGPGDGALRGVRVVEWGSNITAPYAAKLLADLGADVIKLEELPTGDPARGGLPPFVIGRDGRKSSGLFQFLNAGKRGMAVDLRRPAGRRTVEDLLGWADILVHNQPRSRMESLGLEFDDLARLNPRIVVACITPFGVTGPYRDWRACGMILTHLSGLGMVTHWDGLDPEIVPPRGPAGHFVDLTTGAVGAIAALAALMTRDSQGTAQLADVSGWETAIFATFPNMLYPTYEARGLNFRRPHLTQRAPMGYMKCQDGYFWAAVLQPRHWEAFTQLLGVPELAAERLFATPMLRGEYWDVLAPILDAKIATWTKEKLFHACQALGIPIVPAYSVREALESEQIRSRHVLVHVDHPELGPLSMPGNPCRMSETPPVTRVAPRLGEHTDAVRVMLDATRAGDSPATSSAVSADRLPLAGVRVLDLSWVLAGPLSTQMLAHLGAEVIKVESDRIQDIARTNPPFANGRQDPEMSGFYASLAAGKRTFTIDLSTPRGLTVAKELVRASDVVVENFSPGTLDRLGLGYDELKRIRPDVILVSISGAGQTGPLSAYRYFGLQVFAMSGLSLLSSPPGMPPAIIRAGGADPMGAIYATLAALVALQHRKTTGRGQNIDISMLEVTLAHLADAVLEVTMNGHDPLSLGNADDAAAPADCYRCEGEDAWVAIAVHDDIEWASLCRALGDTTLESDPRFRDTDGRRRNQEDLRRRITTWTSQRTPTAAMTALQECGVPAGASFDARAALADRHIVARGFMERVDHHLAGQRLVAGVPWKITGVGEPATPRRVPRRNEAWRYVLEDLLRLPPNEVADLIASRVVPADTEAA